MAKSFDSQFSLHNRRVYIAGINGMVGSAIARRLKKRQDIDVLGLSSTELDLLDQKKTYESLLPLKIDVLIMAAAKVGGIKSNSDFPVDFINNNLSIQLNLLQAAHELGIKRVLFLGSSCIYPRNCPQPIKEDYLFSGKLEETNKAYATAKIAGIAQIQAYREQYGLDWVSAMPCNLYGIGDYFNEERGHVIPSLIQRFHTAVENNLEQITVWGSGNPVREFLYVDDFAAAVEILLEKYNGDSHINIGTGTEISIKTLVDLVARITDYKGEVNWDISKPDGTPRKVLDNSKIHNLGWEPITHLGKGLELTYSWYRDNLNKVRK